MQGRKGKYTEWITESKLSILEQWAIDGLTDAQIAENIGIRCETFCRWKAKYPQLHQAIKKGREVADYKVENALFDSAVGGNVTAMIFWLKNRKPEQWSDRPKAKQKEDDGKMDELIEAIRNV